MIRSRIIPKSEVSISSLYCFDNSDASVVVVVTIPLGIGYYAAHHLELLGGKILARDCTASTTISTASRTIDYLIVLVTARACTSSPRSRAARERSGRDAFVTRSCQSDFVATHHSSVTSSRTFEPGHAATLRYRKTIQRPHSGSQDSTGG